MFPTKVLFHNMHKKNQRHSWTWAFVKSLWIANNANDAELSQHDIRCALEAVTEISWWLCLFIFADRVCPFIQLKQDECNASSLCLNRIPLARWTDWCITWMWDQVFAFLLSDQKRRQGIVQKTLNLCLITEGLISDC